MAGPANACFPGQPDRTGWSHVLSSAEHLSKLTRALNLREGEGRTFLATAAFLFLSTACTTFLGATRNGLFLDVYPRDLIPAAVIAAAATTAVVAVVFSGVISGVARRSLALWLTVILGGGIIACRIAFGIDVRTTFAVYLLLSAIEVLILSHAWDYVGDLLTGRQAKRMLPAIGLGASMGAIAGGAAVAPAALLLGTENVLIVAAILIALGLPALWAVPEPSRDEDEELLDLGAVRSFAVGASRGIRALGSERLLRLLALGVVALTVTSTLIELQLMQALQAFDRDAITAIYGYMAIGSGVGTLLIQVWASRFLLPRLGVSFAAMLQGAALAIAAGAAAILGGIVAIASLRAFEEALGDSLQTPVEQVSLLPFPGKVKSAAVTTLDGVLTPVSTAAAGVMALLLTGRPEWLAPLTVAAGGMAFLVYLRHRSTYMQALEQALARHAVDFGGTLDAPLVVGREALDVIDHALEDEDPSVVVFAASLLEQIPTADAAPRIARLLNHEAPEVRAEIALVLSRLEYDVDDFAGIAVTERLRIEERSFPIASLLEAAGLVPGVAPDTVRPYLTHRNASVRRAALVALARLGVPIDSDLDSLFGSTDSTDRSVASGVVGELKLAAFMTELSRAVEDAGARPAALGALSALGSDAVPVMSALLNRRDLPLPARRTVITALSDIEGRAARDALLALVEEPALGAPALTSLHRMRMAELIDPVDPARLRGVLRSETQQGLKFALVAGAIRWDRGSGSDRLTFIADELEGLRDRALNRVLRILSLSFDPHRLATVGTALGDPDMATRSNALELLEGLITGDTAALVIPFVEAGADGYAPRRVADLLPDSEDWLARPAERLAEEDDWWPQALALHVLERDDEITTPGRSKDEPWDPQENDMIPLIEKVMILKGSQLFRNFPGSDLAGIASLATVVHLAKDEILFEQGAEGDAFYMVVRGAVRISRGSHELAILGSREGFGEMAILDRETRSATATGSEASTLLRIDRDSFDRLIEQNPTVARGIYRVLNERLRNTLAQVAAG